MKLHIALIASILALPAFQPAIALSDEPVLTQARPAMQNGKPLLGVNWFNESQIGFVQVILVWDSFNPEVHKNGFDFTLAKSARLVSPALEAGCQLTSAKGFLPNSMAGEVPRLNGALNLTLSGASCQAMLEALKHDELKTQSLELEFTDVPSVGGNPVLPAVRLTVLPVS